MAMGHEENCPKIAVLLKMWNKKLFTTSIPKQWAMFGKGISLNSWTVVAAECFWMIVLLLQLKLANIDKIIINKEANDAWHL